MKLTPLFLLAISPAFAMTSTNDRVSKLEQQMQQVRTQTVYGNAGAKTASGMPKMNRYGPFVTMDLLCWKPFVGSSEFAFTDNALPPASPFLTEMEPFHFDWRCGLRTSLGYQFSNPDWDLSAVYTHLTTHQVNHTPAISGQSVVASGLPSATLETSAETKWNLSYNVLDFDLARAYFLRSRFSVHPRMGLRTALIHQRDQAQFFYSASSVTRLLKYENSTSGIGLLGGTELRWHWSNQWSMFSNMIASLIYGKMEVHAKSINFGATPTIPLDVSVDTYKVLPNMSLDAGLTWEMAWQRVRLSLAAGYEFQYWWRQNQRPHLDLGTVYSWVRQSDDLGFHGFKFDIALDF